MALNLETFYGKFLKKADKVSKKYLILKNKFNKKQTNTNIKTNTIWVRPSLHSSIFPEF